MDDIIFYKPPASAAAPLFKIRHASTSNNGITFATNLIAPMFQDIDEMLRSLVTAAAINVTVLRGEEHILDPYCLSEDTEFRFQGTFNNSSHTDSV